MSPVSWRAAFAAPMSTLGLFAPGLLAGAVPALAAEPRPWEIGLQPAASPVMTDLAEFHELLTVIIVAIVVFVLGLIVWVVARYRAHIRPTPSRTSHNTALEVAWTVVPVIILVVIAVPSFKTLYFMERIPHADMTVKVTGHQWYWEYAYPDQGDFSYLSTMIPEDQLKPGQLRLLEVDNRLVLPVGVTVRIIVTGADVIHSWAVPAFGIKKDAVPGRLNETWVRVDAPGVYFGQCSQICGVNHAYMPISVEAMAPDDFTRWVAKAKLASAE